MAMSNSNKINNSIEETGHSEHQSIKPRHLVITVVGVLLMVLLAAVYMSDRISSMLSQTSTTSNGLTAHHMTKKSISSQVTPQQLVDGQNNYNDHIAFDNTDTVISYSDFKQEAQNVLFREEGKIVPVKYSVTKIDPTISTEEFRQEAHKILYRETDY